MKDENLHDVAKSEETRSCSYDSIDSFVPEIFHCFESDLSSAVGERFLNRAKYELSGLFIPLLDLSLLIAVVINVMLLASFGNFPVFLFFFLGSGLNL